MVYPAGRDYRGKKHFLRLKSSNQIKNLPYFLKAKVERELWLWRFVVLVCYGVVISLAAWLAHDLGLVQATHVADLDKAVRIIVAVDVAVTALAYAHAH